MPPEPGSMPCHGPTITTTPMMPTAMPSTCSRVSFSMRNASPAMSAVMIGVVALRMLATPEATYCCAHAKSM